MEPCPICNAQAQRQGVNDHEERVTFACQRCGRFRITVTALRRFQNRNPDENARARLSYSIFRRTRGRDDPFEINTLNLDTLLNVALPTPLEQLDNLIIIFGTLAGPSVGAFVTPNMESIASEIGCVTSKDAIYLARQATVMGLTLWAQQKGWQLTLEGWKRRAELLRGIVDGRRAFMAMPFNRPQLEATFTDHFQPSVALTGFKLSRVNDEHRHGRIDDQIMVDIRRSRFVIAEITDTNPNVFWEAGLAEGLGKPVIYTCSADYWNQPDFRSPFDTRQHNTIIWSPETMATDMSRLKAMVRNAFPLDAAMDDREPAVDHAD